MVFSGGARNRGAILRRILFLLALLAGGAGPAAAAEATVAAGWFGRWLTLEVAVAAAAPFRVFTLAGPPRLVVDMEGGALAEIDTGRVALPGVAPGVRTGRLPGNWSRLVLELAAPLAVETAELQGARLAVRLRRVSPAVFAERAGAPPGVWSGEGLADAPGAALTVAIDAGHGGIDPGAVAGSAGDEVDEKTVVLAFAQVLAERLEGDGMRVVMIREEDVFVPLDERVARAEAAGAGLLISLHSNAVSDGSARGAIAFTRADRGSNPEATARALAENAADRAGGLSHAGLDPAILSSLSAMSRRATDRRSEQAAAAIVAALAAADAATARYPRQSADFAVLAAPELPSVLLELGFLSNPADRANLVSPAWRLRAAEALRRGIRAWAESEGGRPVARD